MKFLAFNAIVSLAFGTYLKVSVDPSSGLMVDSDGNRRIFHGVNAVEKLGSLLPSTESFDVVHSLADKDLEYLEEWGMNVVRLGVLWSGVTPTADSQGRGIVNATYLQLAKTLIEKMAAKGIYTIVDAHQDNLNRRTCGEGVPMWVYDKALALEKFDATKDAFPKPMPFNIPRDDNGFPLLSACQKYQFFLEGLSYENNAAWNGIYTQSEIHQDFADSWGGVAQALAGTPGLLGYELINEPWIGSNTLVNDYKSLFPLYKAATSAIRQHDGETIIMFEPLVFDSYLSVVYRSPEFPPYGIEGINHTAKELFSYHSYCLDFNETKVPETCKLLLSATWRGIRDDLKKFHLGGFLTEFGAVGDDTGSIALLNTQMDYADQQFQSWTYWTYKSYDDITTQNSHTETFFNQDGSLQINKIKALSRTYAPSIGGNPSKMSYDPATAAFELIYETVAECSGSSCLTRIYTYKLNYPHGFSVSVTPAQVSWTQNNNMVIVMHPNLPAGQTVKVSITMKS